MAADVAIMGDVGVDHEQVLITDLGPVVGTESAMDGNVLADRVAFPNPQPAHPFAGPQVLGAAAQNGGFRNGVVLSQSRARLDHDMAGQTAALADNRAGLHDTERADRDIRGDFRTRINHCCRVYA